MPPQVAELIAPGGPSGPVWIMLLGIITLLLNQFFAERKAKRERREQKEDSKEAALQAKHAAEVAEQTVKNTQNISNGFARRVDTKLDATLAVVQDIETRLTEHLAWHLTEEQEKRRGTHEQPEERPSV